MLVLSRKVGEEVVINGEIRITICRIDGNQVRIGFQAPPEVHIVRAELKPLKQSEKKALKKNGVAAAQPVVKATGSPTAGSASASAHRVAAPPTSASRQKPLVHRTAWLRRRAR